MNSEIKEKWINALRSQEYKQSQHYLRDDYGYCCLGVLCDIYAKEMNVPWEQPYEEDGINDYYYFNEAENLPIEVIDWAELKYESPSVTVENGDIIELAKLNDTGTDFLTISNLIEKSL
jgi:hypothetical protein